MRYPMDDAMREIMVRKDRIVRRREQARRRRLGGAAVLLALALVLTFSTLHLPSDPAAFARVRSSARRAFLLSAQAGGYVLLGMVCFGLGVCFTLLCSRIRERNRRKGPTKEEEE